jgi:hypothetical protein
MNVHDESNELDEAILRELDATAAALDALELAPEPDLPTIAAKRRFLLDDLELAGIFDQRGTELRGEWLEHRKLPALLAYHRAAVAAWSYYHGTQRRADLTEPVMPARLADGPLAIDWFRRPSVPPAPWTFERLCISSELTFKSMYEKPDRDQGTYYFSSGRLRGQYWFRTDFQRPQLYRADVTR